MKLGTESREQVYLLAGLALVAGYMVYLNWPWPRPSPPAPPPASRPRTPGSRVRRSIGEVGAGEVGAGELATPRRTVL
jgi:hypothetical protein